MQMVAFQHSIGRRSFGSHRCRSYGSADSDKRIGE
jgi:hypothetical protein